MSTLLTIAGSVGDFLATVPQQVIAQVGVLAGDGFLDLHHHVLRPRLGGGAQSVDRGLGQVAEVVGARAQPLAAVLDPAGDGIAGAVQAMTRAMQTLAQGDTKVEIPARGRGDEIGAMAASVHSSVDARLIPRRPR